MRRLVDERLVQWNWTNAARAANSGGIVNCSRECLISIPQESFIKMTRRHWENIDCFILSRFLFRITSNNAAKTSQNIACKLDIQLIAQSSCRLKDVWLYFTITSPNQLQFLQSPFIILKKTTYSPVFDTMTLVSNQSISGWLQKLDVITGNARLPFSKCNVDEPELNPIHVHCQ